MSGFFLSNLKKKYLEKYLEYSQPNPYFFSLFEAAGFTVKTPDGGRRIDSRIMLGILMGMDQEIANLVPLFLKLNNNPDLIVESLGLHFDPRIEWQIIQELEAEREAEERINQTMAESSKAESEKDPDVEYLNQIRETL